MKILAFVDIHGSHKALRMLEKKAKQAEILICAGDISQFEMDLDKLLAKLSSFGKLVLMIHGNHEEPDMLDRACSKFDNIVFMHKQAKIIDNFVFIGFGGGGFDKTTPKMVGFFEKHEKTLKMAKKAVFITHAPPYKTVLDKLNGSHNGNNTTRNMIIKYQPSFVVCGHFHENWQKHDKLGKSRIVNPGPSGAILKL